MTSGSDAIDGAHVAPAILRRRGNAPGQARRVGASKAQEAFRRALVTREGSLECATPLRHGLPAVAPGLGLLTSTTGRRPRPSIRAVARTDAPLAPMARARDPVRGTLIVLSLERLARA